MKHCKKIFLVLCITLVASLLMGAKSVEAAELGNERVYGQNRYETNRAVLNKALEGKEASKVIMIDSDAKVGLSNAIKLSFEQKLPIVLADSSQQTVDYLKKLKVNEILAIGNSKAYPILAKQFKLTKVAPEKEVKIEELMKLIPASNSEKVAYIPTSNTKDFLSGINLQSVGNYKIVPRYKIDPMEINKYQNLVMVGSKDVLDFTTRVVLDPNKAHKWQDAAWMLYNNQLLDCLYDTNKVVKEGDVYKVIYTDKPFKLQMPKNYDEKKALEAFSYRFNENFNSVVRVQSDKQEYKNLSTFDTKTKIYTPKFSITYTEQQLKIRNEINGLVKKWAAENISKDMTNRQKAEKIFNYIVDNSENSLEDVVAPDGTSFFKGDIAATLMLSKGNCASKTKTFSALGKATNLIVYDETGEVDGGLHAWNLVKDNDKIYAIDATFGINNRNNRYKYLYRTQEEFQSMGYKKR